MLNFFKIIKKFLFKRQVSNAYKNKILNKVTTRQKIIVFFINKCYNYRNDINLLNCKLIINKLSYIYFYYRNKK